MTTPAFTRWTLQNLALTENYTFESNPYEQTSPVAGKDVQFTPQNRTVGLIPTAFVGIRAKRQPVDWSFTGIVRSVGEYNALLTWSKRPERLLLTNDRGEVLTIKITGITFARQAPQRQRTPYRHKYTVKATVYAYQD